MNRLGRALVAPLSALGAVLAMHACGSNNGSPSIDGGQDDGPAGTDGTTSDVLPEGSNGGDGGPPGSAVDEEFVGPLAGWADLKAGYHAVGDGNADDTAAWQSALADVGTAGKPAVLYVPAGTYKITQPLQMTTRIGATVVGDDPTTTTLKWAGASGAVMFTANGVAYSAFGRMTFDGGGAAVTGMSHSWDGSVDYFPTHSELADIVFQNMAVGQSCLHVGAGPGGNAEMTVKRSRFLQCAVGVAVTNYNALDWFFWDSTFDGNGTGLQNTAGNFHVYRSLFRQSKKTDVEIVNKGYFGFRHNWSVGSNQTWIDDGPSGNPDLVAMQGNTIVAPSSPSAGPVVVMNCMGPLQMLDNVIQTPDGQTGPVVKVSDFGPAALLSAGNTFTRAQAIQVAGTQRSFGADMVVANSSLSLTPPPPHPFAPHVVRPIVEVAAGGDGKAVQAAIDTAAQMIGKRPVVHLPAGTISVSATLKVPPGVDMQIIGDGFMATRLAWSGSGTGPVLDIAGPTGATLREFQVVGNSGMADGIVIHGVDAAGARIAGDQLATEGDATGLDVHGLTAARVEVRTMYHSTTTVMGVSVANPPGTALVALLGGSESNNAGGSYAVAQGSRLAVEDIWYEGVSPPAFVTAKDQAVFAYQLGRFAPNHADAGVLAAGGTFGGTVGLFGLNATATLATGPMGPSAWVLFAGSGIGTATEMSNGSGASAAFVENVLYQGPMGVPSAATDVGTASDAQLQKAYALIRNVAPADLTAATPSGATDLRIHRVSATGARTGLVVEP
jgi:hypothetical protein